MTSIELSDGPFYYGFGARPYPRWRSWVAIAASVIAVVAGILVFTFGFGLAPVPMLIAVAVLVVALVTVALNT